MDDLISRKDALRPFCINSKGERIPERDCDNWQVQIPIADVKKILREVPTAEPQIIHCKDCKHRGTHNCIANLWAAIFKTAVQDDFYCGIGERWDGGGQ